MSFGEIALETGAWRITCEPHVRNRLRRVFPQVSQNAGEVITLSDNTENARDLLWFTQRYPMKLARAALQLLKTRAKAHEETETLIHALLEHRRPAEDFELALPAREYQKVAANLAMIKSGLVLADDVGLGKTVSSICTMVKQENLPVLVVTLTHLPEQWAAELKAFAPNLQVHILKTGKPYDLVPKRKTISQHGLFESDGATGGEGGAPRMPDVIIASYSKLNGWAETLAGVVRAIIFDEGQELRRTESQKYAAAKLVAAKCHLRMALTATPIYNMGVEFFNLIDIILPGCLGTKAEFVREWGTNEEQIRDPKAFGAYLRREGIMLRRTRAEVGRELPPCSRLIQTIHTDDYVLNKVQGSAIELAKIILANQQNYRGEKFQASEQFNVMLRQATGIAKAPYVAEFVRLLMASEEKVILFGWHRDVYSIWMEQLADFKPMLYTGSESPSQKAAAKDAFVNGDCRVLIISLRAGAGLDGLQDVCKVGVFGEIDWSPGVHTQCIGRYWRDGQLDPVLAYFLLSEDGSDPVIADILGLKRGQSEGVLEPHADLLEQLAVEPGSIKRLATAYLQKLGIDLPGESSDVPIQTGSF